MSLKIEKSLVSVDWLQSNLNDENLIILDCTIPKVTAIKSDANFVEKLQIKGARFFDIKNTFSDKKAPLPNTVLSSREFEEKAIELGINNNSCIVVYDDLGIYSSPRVWWLFHLMGFKNIAVLEGGFPKWKSMNYPIEKPTKKEFLQGDFKVDYQAEKIKFTKDVLSAIDTNEFVIADARSEGRFLGTIAEPRKEVRSGHIPNSKSLPFSNLLHENEYKSEEELKAIFKNINPEKKNLIFSCGSGITACVLALGAEIAGYKNYAVYDGSWTEWGSSSELLIEI